MPSRSVLRLALLTVALGCTAAAAFVVGRRWPIARLDALLARLRPSVAAAALLPWQVTDTLPLTRYENGAALIGHELYFLGGFYNEATQATDRVDVLDLAQHRWRRGAPLPEPLTHGNVVVLGDTAIWVVGGFKGDSPGPTVAATWRYRVAADQWVAGPPLPAARGGGGLAALGDTLHYFGGWMPDRNTDSPDHWRLLPGADRWEPRAPLPQPRGHLATGVMDGMLFGLGGNHGHDPTPIDVPTVHRYDPGTDTWSEAPGLVRARSHTEPGTIRWRDRFLLAGGRDIAGAEPNVGDVVSWQPATGRARYVLSLPMALLAPTAAVIGDTLVVGGGAPRGNNPTNRLVWRAPLVGAWLRYPSLPKPLGEVSAAVLGDRLFVMGDDELETFAFDLRTGRWDDLHRWEARPVPGHHHAAEVLGGELVLIGGLGSDRIGGMVQLFNADRNSWRFGPKLPVAAGSVATAVIDGKLFVAGGIVGNRTVADAFVLDSGATAWRRIASMPRPRNHAASATDGHRLWVFGGRGPGSGDSNVVANGFADVQVYDPATDQWTVSDGSAGSPLPVPVARGGMGKAVYLDGEFWVLGGETVDGVGATRGGTYARVDIYDPIARRWRLGPALQTGRHGIFPVLEDGRILVAGGGERAGHGTSTTVESLRPK